MAIREHMLDYVIDLLDDATDFSWASTKASHVVLLCRIEQAFFNTRDHRIYAQVLLSKPDKTHRVITSQMSEQHTTLQGT